MLIDFKKILNALPKRPSKILHCGAHLAEESDVYEAEGFYNTFWVEPNPELYEQIVRKLGDKNVINLAVSNTNKDNVDFHRIYNLNGDNKGCSSLLEPTHILDNPYLKYIDTIKVGTTTIYHLNKYYGPFDFLNMDIQGHELLALQGAKKLLMDGTLLGILVEYSLVQFYKGDCLLTELDDYLKQYGYYRVITQIANDKNEFGDALFIRERA